MRNFNAESVNISTYIIVSALTKLHESGIYIDTECFYHVKCHLPDIIYCI
jgi:hypothetical protein